MGGTRRTPLLGALPSDSVHVQIWEWNSIPERILNTPAYQRARRECQEQRVIVVVVGDVGAIVVVSDVKTRTKNNPQRMYIYSPIKQGTGTRTKNTHLPI